MNEKRGGQHRKYKCVENNDIPRRKTSRQKKEKGRKKSNPQTKHKGDIGNPLNDLYPVSYSIHLGMINHAPNSLMLFQKQKGHNRVGPQAYKTWHPPFKQPPDTFSPIPAPQQPQHPPTATALSRHNPRLDHIYRGAYSRSHKPCSGGRKKMGKRIILPQGRLLCEDCFKKIIGSQLRRGHEHCAETVWPYAAEQGPESFFACHAH